MALAGATIWEVQSGGSDTANGGALCGQCRETKPLSEFAKCSRERSGRQAACKACRNGYTRRWYQANRERARASINKWRGDNRERVNANSRRWASNNSEKFKGVRRKSRYGIDDAAYSALVEAQAGKCAICGESPTQSAPLHIDHDHSCCSGDKSCGRCVRGLICFRCNSGLGMFGDDIARLNSAIKYLGRDR